MNLRPQIKNTIIEFICLLFVLLFVYASTNKLLDYENFRVQLGQSPLLSAFAFWISWLVPLFELIISCLLIFRSTRMYGLLLAFNLMIMFTVYIFIILHYSSYVPCSCGGILEKMSWNAHMLFNFIFIALAVIAIVLHRNNDSKIKNAKLTATSIKAMILSSFCSVLTVVILYICSEKIMHYSNPFQRRYPKNTAVQLQQIDLKFNSYYIAGFTKGRLYLGNFSNPQILTSFDNNLGNKKIAKINFDPGNIPFQNVTLCVRENYFYLKDGMVPALFRGSIKDWKINTRLNEMPFFTQAEPIDSTTIIFRNNSGKNMSNRLGIFNYEKENKITYKDSLLEKQIDGIFDTDGLLMYSEHNKKIIYLYYYRNEFIVAEKTGKLVYKGHTIDTTTKAKIKVTNVKKGAGRTMSAPPFIVNAHSFVFKNLLFVNSRVMGKYEDKNTWEYSSVIDIYDISKQTYLFSFSIYNIDGDNLKSFIVDGTYLYALIGNNLAVYKLKENIQNELKSSEIKLR